MHASTHSCMPSLITVIFGFTLLPNQPLNFPNLMTSDTHRFANALRFIRKYESLSECFYRGVDQQAHHDTIAALNDALPNRIHGHVSNLLYLFLGSPSFLLESTSLPGVTFFTWRHLLYLASPSFLEVTFFSWSSWILIRDL